MRKGSNNPEALQAQLDWIPSKAFKTNVFLMFDAHCDSATGNLIVGGTAENQLSATLTEVR